MRCSHTGISHFVSSSGARASSSTPCFSASFSVFRILFSMFADLAFGFQSCVSRFQFATTSSGSLEFFGHSLQNISSIMYAHLGLSTPMFRYCLTHIRSIASFQAARCSIFRPPHSISSAMFSMHTVARPLPHRNSVMAPWMSFRTESGIPCALVMNCVFPPATICIMWRFPSRVGYLD